MCETISRERRDADIDSTARPDSENSRLALTFLDRDDLVKLNFLVLQLEHGGRDGVIAAAVINPGLLESIVDGHCQTVFGYDPYPSLSDKAAYLLVSLAYHQCFGDGNKRTAWEACRIFLRLNRVGIHYSTEAAVQLCIGIAQLRDKTPPAESIDQVLDMKIRETSNWISSNRFTLDEQ